MLDLEAMIHCAACEPGAAPIAVAAPFDVPERLLRDLAQKGVVRGYVADTAPDPSSRDPLVVGWWVDRRAGTWTLKSRGLRMLVLLGATSEHGVSGRMLLEARLKGVERLLLVGPAGDLVRDINTEGGLLEALDRSDRGPRFGETGYEELFEDIYSLVGDRLRLPPSSFVPDRALLIVGSLGPGGAERQVAYTAIGLKERSALDVYIGYNHGPPPADFFRPTVEGAGAHVVMVPERSPEYDSAEMLEIRNRLSRHDVLAGQNVFYTILHYALLLRALRPVLLHVWLDYCNTLAGTAAALVGVPGLVVSGRSVSPESFRIFHPFMRPGYKALLRRRRDLVMLNNSRAGAADYARWLDLPVGRVKVIHNGFIFPAELPKAAGRAMRRQYGIADVARVVGSILRFSDEKRPELLIDMARCLHEHDPSLRFLFFGEGVLLEQMQAYVASFGLETIIRLPGLTSDVWSALAGMDVFVLTSRMEGLPNVLIEAQASGLPVVCTGVGGMPETFVDGETGFSVPTAAPEALAEAVRGIFTVPGLIARMSGKAFTHAREAFSVEPMIRHTLQAYREADPAGLNSPSRHQR